MDFCKFTDAAMAAVVDFHNANAEVHGTKKIKVEDAYKKVQNVCIENEG